MFVDVRDLSGVLGLRAKQVLGVDFCVYASESAPFFSVFPRFWSSMLWVVDATYYVLRFCESFRVLLWGSVSMGTRGHKHLTLISMFRYFIQQNNIS